MKNLQLYLLLCFPILLCAQGKQGYTVPYQDVKINVLENLSFEVTEEINVHFSERRRGIFTSIPLVYDIDGSRVTIKIDQVKVIDHTYKVSRERGEINIRIGDANKYVTGDQTYLVNYRVKDAIASYEDHEEFYWNIIPFDRDDRIGRSSFTVSFPEAWADSLYTFRAFSGYKGEQGADVVVHKEGNAIVGALRSPLEPKQGLTLVVKIPKGLSSSRGIQLGARSLDQRSQVTAQEEPAFSWATSWWNALPIGLSAFLLSLYRRFQHDSRDDEEVPLQTHPPEEMSPAEVGTFYDYKVNRRDIISLIPYWGNQGYLSISPIQDGSGDMHFKRIKDLPAGAPDYQHCLYDGLFADGDLVRLSDLEEKFYSTMSKTAKLLRKKAHDKELYDATSVSALHRWWMIPIGILGIVIGGLLTGNGIVAAGIGMIIIGIATIIIFFIPPRLSDKGKRYKDHLKGFYDHLKNPVESKVQELLDRDPAYFHHMYPYVLAFDLDRSWAPVKYPKLDYMPPIWFDSRSGDRRGFNYGNINKSINVRKIEKVFYSTPPPPKSSGGGSIGGGFSGGSAGGGFGGGSRGSW